MIEARPSGQPIDVKDQASDNLAFIRGAMERAERVSSASGAGGMVMGTIAIGAMLLSNEFLVGGFFSDGFLSTGAEVLQGQLTIWIGAAFLALLAGSAGSWRKARRNDLVLLGDPGRRFLLCLIPALLVGAVMTFALWSTELIVLVPGLWMMLYGCGVLAAGTYAAPPVMQMGGCFLLAGLVTHALPAGWSNLMLGTGFGGLHLLFGYQVYRHHGG